MSHQSRSTRREFIRNTTVAAAALSGSAAVPGCARGREHVSAPSERVTLGVIGMGPRCRYVLPQMLKHPDVQCVAMADVQKSRRDAA